MEFQQLDVTIRGRGGKGPARRMRQGGRVPAVLYGRGIPAITLSLVPREIVKALAGPLRTNTVLKLKLQGATGSMPAECLAMVRDHQFDPVSRELLHVDFLAVALDREVKVEVPLRLFGRSAGEAAGGTLTAIFRTLPVQCLPTAIPEEIAHDITALELNQHLTAGELVMPPGAVVLMDKGATIATVATKRIVDETKVAKEGEEAGEGAAEEGAEKAAAEGEPDAKE